MKIDYGGVIWTKHALARLAARRIAQGDAWVAFTRADQSRYAATKGAWIYYKTMKGSRIEVVAKKNSKGQWLILSVWAKPVPRQDRSFKKSNWFLRLLRQIFFGDYR